jgi:NAD(P)-dependent dehydrogenase (short-subunit alcohol dehydrogenase family)
VLFARGDSTLKESAGAGRKPHCIPGDVTRPEDLERLFRETKDRFGRVDAMLANAAAVKLSPIRGGGAVLDAFPGDQTTRSFFKLA